MGVLAMGPAIRESPKVTNVAKDNDSRSSNDNARLIRDCLAETETPKQKAEATEEATYLGTRQQERKTV